MIHFKPFTIDQSLAAKRSPFWPYLVLYGAADLIRGGGSYACPRSGCLLACPLQPDTSRREGSLVKSAVALDAWSRTAARVRTSLFAPADRRLAPPLRERQRELRRARRVGGVCGPAGRLVSRTVAPVGAARPNRHERAASWAASRGMARGCPWGRVRAADRPRGGAIRQRSGNRPVRCLPTRASAPP